MDKIKVLITGPVNGSFTDLRAKLTSLQKSKAGPFHICFCVGPFFSSSSTSTSSSSSSSSIEKELEGMPLPIYFCDVGSLPLGYNLPSVDFVKKAKDDAEISLDDDDDEEEEDDNGDKDVNGDEEGVPKRSKGIIRIAPNVYHLHGIGTATNTNGSGNSEAQAQSQTADIVNIYPDDSNDKTYLTVAFVPPNARMHSLQSAILESKTNHASYVGCDLLLTSDWGQGMASSACIAKDDLVKIIGNENGNSSKLNEVGSYDVAEMASRCRPRYHVTPSILIPVVGSGEQQQKESFFIQSLQYTNPPSAMASGVMKNYHTSRFLSLCPVVDAKTQKKNGKTKKYIHALGIQPLWSMDRITATKIPENTVVVPCPYTDEHYEKDGSRNGNGNGNIASASGMNMNMNTTMTTNVNVGLSAAQTRRILNEDAVAGTGDHNRWNIRNNHRKRPLDNGNGNGNGGIHHQDPQIMAANDPYNCTLFLHGLHNDVTGGVNVNRESIFNAFQNESYKCTRVVYPPSGSPSYCFLEFETHDEAKACLEHTAGNIKIAGVDLTLKWGKSNRRQNQNVGGGIGVPPPPPPGHVGIYGQQQQQFNNEPPHKRNRLTAEEASDSSSLFVHLNANKMSAEVCSLGIQQVGKLAQKMLEDAINMDVKDDKDRITASDDEALQVVARNLVMKFNCGFLDFASHAAASMAMATMTGSTDGGTLQHDFSKIVEDGGGSGAEGEGKGEEGDNIESIKEALKDVQIWWAKPRDPNANNASMPRENNRFKFKSHHFPPDARTDCWFCLASPTCEKHLIVNIFDHCYITMPKGPVNKHHSLVVPVNHSHPASEIGGKRPILGAYLDSTPGAVEDVEEAIRKLRKFSSTQLEKDLFVFERAFPTRGGYHSHINCIPVDRGLGPKIRTTMMSMAAAANRGVTIDIRELQNPEISVTSLLKNAEDDGLSGYFYCEVPFGENGDFKRFLYTATDEGEQKGGYGGNGGGRKHIPLQFGREILASVMGDEDLAHWKGCVLSREIEEEYTESFRKSFDSYN